MITLPDPSPVRLDPTSPGRFMLSLAARQRRTLVSGGVVGTLWMLCPAAIPLAVGRTLDAGVVRGDGAALLVGCLVIAGLGALGAGFGLLRHRLAVANWLQAALRGEQVIGHHVADQGLAVTAATTTGEVVEVASTDVPRLADLADITARATGAVLTYAAVTVLLIRMDPLLGLCVSLGLPLLTATLAVVVRPLQARQQGHRSAEGRLTELGADTVAGLRVLRGFGGEPQFLGRYQEANEEVRQAGLRVAGPQAALDAAHVLLPGVFVVALTWLGAHAALAGRVSPGELVTLYGYAAFLRLPLETATETLSKSVRAWVAAGRITALLNTRDPARAATPDGAPPPPPLAAPGMALHDPVSGLSVPPGRLTALVTARPDEAVAITDRLAGLARLAEAQGPADPDAVRARVLLSEAEPRLFSGLLGDELDPYGRHSDAERRAAIEVADALDVLAGLPDGLTGRIEERGRDLSGGQRQRLALARALLADPEVLLLVEPTSAVDAHTEARIAGRLRAARAGRTTLVATASPLLLDRCDEVVLVAAGRVVAMGGHHELLRTRADYRDVVFRGEEFPGEDFQGEDFQGEEER